MTAVETFTGGNGRSPLQFTVPELIELADRLATVEGFVPKVLLNRPPAVLATLLAGNELGLAPVSSLRAIHVIEGRVTLSASVAQALVYAAGHRLDVTMYEDAEVAVRGRRRDETNWTTISWTWGRAQRAKLTGKQVWNQYPRQMLSARAHTELCRLKFSDVLFGLEIAPDLEDALVVEGDTPVGEQPRTSKRRANVKAPEIAPSAPADEPQAPLIVESVAEGAPTPEPVPESRQLPPWQRKLHARVSEVFAEVDADVRDAFRHAMVAVLTRGRDTGSVESSSELTEPERQGFDTMLDSIQTGECLIARLESGTVEIRKSGWCYRVAFDPLAVTTIREAG